ncbi:MAG: hypothetical protein JRF33_05865 [Deltaproteobacteria bacterium]|nr:hypothetical protein [Deltaproteobacteria bacterium]
MNRTVEPSPRRFAAHPGWHVLGALVVLLWLAVMAGMFGFFGGEGEALDLSAEDLKVSPPLGERWMGAYQNGRKLGWVHTESLQDADGTFRFVQRTELLFSVGGMRQRFESTLHVSLGRDQALEHFDFQMQAGPLSVEAEGRWTGKAIEIEAGLGSRKVVRRLEMDHSPVFDLTLPAVLVRQDLSSGQRYRVTLFDPQSLSHRPAIIEVVGPEALSLGGGMKPAIHFRRRVAGLQVDSWIDAKGRLLKEVVDGGLELMAEDEALAKRGLDAKGLDTSGLPGLDSLRGLGAL